MIKAAIDEILEVSFHGSEPSQGLKSELEHRVEGLQTRYPDITSWRVFVEGPSGSAGLFHVTIEVRVPGAARPVTAMRTPTPLSRCVMHSPPLSVGSSSSTASGRAR
jgi:hypothetical protein